MEFLKVVTAHEFGDSENACNVPGSFFRRLGDEDVGEEEFGCGGLGCCGYSV
jgi:hypothetical protein